MKKFTIYKYFIILTSFLFLTFGLGVIASPAFAQQTNQPDSGQAAVTGDWHGRLGGMLRLVFHIKRDSGGTLIATMDSPDQGAKGIPVSNIQFSGDSLLIDVATIRATFKGKILENRQVITGKWTQLGRSLPLTLKRGPRTKLRRPQTPEPPFPYESVEVTFQNEKAGITLAGTLTLPRGEKPYPAVVLISGSGPQDRNMTLFGHKPFFVLADYLTRRGIAVLRYDERGVGESTGHFSLGTTREFAYDVQAAVDYLQNRGDIGEIGLLGWSEGAIVAPMVSARSEVPAFLVLIGAPAVPGKKIIPEQVELISSTKGMPNDQTAQVRVFQERIVMAVTQASDSAAAAEQLRNLLKEHGMNKSRIEASIRKLTSPWYRFFLSYNPKRALRKVKVPVLAIYGTKDLQVSPEQNAEPLRKALKDNPDVTVKVLIGLNHLLQPAGSGLPSEYAQIETTIAPKALEVIGEWVMAQTELHNKWPNERYRQ